jgi:hypothetical protein
MVYAAHWEQVFKLWVENEVRRRREKRAAHHDGNRFASDSVLA